MPLTPNEKKLEKVTQIIEKGNLAILEYLLEIEEKLDKEIPGFKEVIERMKGDKGDGYNLTDDDKQEIKEYLINEIDFEKLRGQDGANYILTENDRQEIAKGITVPIVKQIVEKIETIREVPLVVETIREVAVLDPDILPQYGNQFRDGLELLLDDQRLDYSAIKNKPDYKWMFRDLEGLKIAVAGSRYLDFMADVNPTGKINDSVLKWSVAQGKWIIGTSGSTITSSDASLTVAGSDVIINTSHVNTWKVRQNFLDSTGTFGVFLDASTGLSTYGTNLKIASYSISTDSYDYANGNVRYDSTTSRLIISNEAYVTGTMGVGVFPSGSIQFFINGTGEQFRSGYNSTNYWNAITGATGITTFDAVGASAKFVFSDNVETTKNFALPTTSSTVGQIIQNGNRVFHTYGVGNTFLGEGAGNFTLTTASATSNVGLGFNSTNTLTTGTSNVGIGAYSLSAGITTGTNNVGVGYGALYGTAVGVSYNLAFGSNALNATTGSNNVGIGASSQINSTGSFNVGVGTQTMGAGVSGSFNTSLGYGAGYGITSGQSNIIIGSGVDVPTATVSGQLNIGNVIYGLGFYGSSTVSATPTAGGVIGIGLGASSSTRLVLAGSTTAISSLRVTSGTAPTSPISGDFWHDSTQKGIQVFTDGIKQTILGTVFTQTADKTVSNTPTETSIVGTGVGGLTLPANFWVAGKTIRITMSGVYSTVAVTGDVVTIKIKAGSATLATKATTALVTGGTNLAWRAEVLVTCRTTGVSGTVQVSGGVTYQIAAAATVFNEINNGVATSSLDTTASGLFDITITHGTVDPANIVKSLVSSFEIIN